MDAITIGELKNCFKFALRVKPKPGQRMKVILFLRDVFHLQSKDLIRQVNGCYDVFVINLGLLVWSKIGFDELYSVDNTAIFLQNYLNSFPDLGEFTLIAQEVPKNTFRAKLSAIRRKAQREINQIVRQAEFESQKLIDAWCLYQKNFPEVQELEGPATHHFYGAVPTVFPSALAASPTLIETSNDPGVKNDQQLFVE